MLRIDMAKFKEACTKVREEYAANGVPEYLDGILHFYRFELCDFRKSFRVATPKPIMSASQLFAEQVRDAALLTNDAVRATPAQIRQIISLANDLEDWTPIGQSTLTRQDASQIIAGMHREIERLGDKELGK